jgi:putative aminopeptidase FrvX
MELENDHFLYKYINNPSPVGFEAGGQKLWLDHIKPFVDTHFTDEYGTAVAVVNPDAEYRVIIEAHADEVSWLVNYISNDGFIYVRKNGGADPAIAPSKLVHIHTSKGMVKGVFGWPAVHVRDTKNNEAATEDTIFVDCGCHSKKEVEDLGIEVGSVITYADELVELNGRYLAGRALDNRIGGYILTEVARLLKTNRIELSFGLYIVNSVQEEVGLRGAQMIAPRIKPHVSLIVDLTHDTQAPGYNKKKFGDLSCGKGPVINLGPAVHNGLRNLIIHVAKENSIPFQKAISSKATGTDTDTIAYSPHSGVAALISLAQKYMHTTVEMVHMQDITHTIQLIYEVLLSLKPDQDFCYDKGQLSNHF